MISRPFDAGQTYDHHTQDTNLVVEHACCPFDRRGGPIFSYSKLGDGVKGRACPISCTNLSESFAGQSAIVANAPNSLRDRFPSELWGLSPLQCLLQDSTLSSASSKDRNQCSLRHSCLKRPLNDSMKALFVGILGHMKSSYALFRYAHQARLELQNPAIAHQPKPLARKTMAMAQFVRTLLCLAADFGGRSVRM